MHHISSVELTRICIHELHRCHIITRGGGLPVAVQEPQASAFRDFAHHPDGRCSLQVVLNEQVTVQCQDGAPAGREPLGDLVALMQERRVRDAFKANDGDVLQSSRASQR